MKNTQNKRLLLFSLLIFFYKINNYAQVSKIDSLIKVQATLPNDTIRGNILLSILNLMSSEMSSQYDYLGEEAIQLCNKLAWKRGQSRAYARYGNYIYVQNKFQIALSLYEKALFYSEANNDTKYANNCYFNIGNSYEKMYQYPKALEYRLKLLNRAKIQKDTATQIEVLNLLGNIHFVLNEHQKGISYLNNAIELNVNQREPSLYRGSLSAIGVCYIGLKQYDNAIGYFEKIEKETKDEDVPFHATNYLNIGVCFERKKDYPKALEYAKKALALSLVSGDKRMIANSSFNVGSVYFFMKEYALSLPYNLKSLNISKETNNIAMQKDASIGIADAYEGLGQKEKALKYLRLHLHLRDSILSDEKQKYINKSLASFEFEKQHFSDSLIQSDNLKLKNVEIARQRTYIWSGLVALILALLFGASVYFGLQQTKKERAKSEALLLNILPASVAEELKQTGKTKARTFDNVTVLMTDFVNFTQVSEQLNAEELVVEIDTCFKAFDEIMGKYGLEKIKTVGDAYVAVCGIPNSNAFHTYQAVKAAQEIVAFMRKHSEQNQSRVSLKEIRIGLHSGSVIAGVVGSKKFAYDIWGDTVNIAARMEQNCLPQNINVSGEVYQNIKNDIECTYRGKIEAKNKGEIDMYLVAQSKKLKIY